MKLSLNQRVQLRAFIFSSQGSDVKILVILI